MLGEMHSSMCCPQTMRFDVSWCERLHCWRVISWPADDGSFEGPDYEAHPIAESLTARSDQVRVIMQAHLRPWIARTLADRAEARRPTELP